LVFLGGGGRSQQLCGEEIEVFLGIAARINTAIAALQGSARIITSLRIEDEFDSLISYV